MDVVDASGLVNELVNETQGFANGGSTYAEVLDSPDNRSFNLSDGMGLPFIVGRNWLRKL